MLPSVGPIVEFLVSIQPESLSMALMKAWQSNHIDKELSPPSKPNTVQELFSQAGLEGSFQ